MAGLRQQLKLMQKGPWDGGEGVEAVLLQNQRRLREGKAEVGRREARALSPEKHRRLQVS